jgi:hypothetical protein
MSAITTRRVFNWANVAVFLLGISFVLPAKAEPGNDNRAPDLGHCKDLKVPKGHKVSFHAYAEGVQVYS